MKVVYDILTNLMLIFSLYFVITGLFAFKKYKIKKISDKKNKFAILIACRNEEKVIGALIDSLKVSNCDSKFYEIVVLPNNCTDNTEEVAKSKNVRVVKVTEPVKTKGEVLRYAFKKLKKPNSKKIFSRTDTKKFKWQIHKTVLHLCVCLCTCTPTPTYTHTHPFHTSSEVTYFFRM